MHRMPLPSGEGYPYEASSFLAWSFRHFICFRSIRRCRMSCWQDSFWRKESLVLRKIKEDLRGNRDRGKGAFGQDGVVRPDGALSASAFRRSAAACGDCQSVALKPDILCFDEPTSALDPELPERFKGDPQPGGSEYDYGYCNP